MDGRLVFEVTISNKKGIIYVFYRYPSQTADKFEEFIFKLDHLLHEITLMNSSFIVLLGDFNAKSSTWYDKDTTANEGSMLESLTSSYGLSQMIKNPTHLLATSFILH